MGHAVELASGFRLRHGEAVAIGMVAAARLAEQLDLAQTGLSGIIAEALDRLGLPHRCRPGWSGSASCPPWSLDKKRRSGKLRLVLPTRIGACRWGVEVEDPAQLLDLV